MKRTFAWTLFFVVLMSVGLKSSALDHKSANSRRPSSLAKRHIKIDREIDTILSQHELCVSAHSLQGTPHRNCLNALSDLRDELTSKMSYEDYMRLLRDNEEDMSLPQNARRQNLASRLALQGYRKSEQPFCERHQDDLDILKGWCKQNPCDCALTAATLPLYRCDIEVENCSLPEAQISKRLYEIDEEDDGISGLYFSWLTTHGYLRSAKKAKKGLPPRISSE